MTLEEFIHHPIPKLAFVALLCGTVIQGLSLFIGLGLLPFANQVMGLFLCLLLSTQLFPALRDFIDALNFSSFKTAGASTLNALKTLVQKPLPSLENFFKNLKQSAKLFNENLAQYDILAKHSPSYGYLYLCLEVFFGLALLSSSLGLYGNLCLFAWMSVSVAGPLRCYLNHEKPICACAGKASTPDKAVSIGPLTILENASMAAMALFNFCCALGCGTFLSTLPVFGFGLFIATFFQFYQKDAPPQETITEETTPPQTPLTEPPMKPCCCRSQNRTAPETTVVNVDTIVAVAAKSGLSP